MNPGKLDTIVKDHVLHLEFFHPKANCLPSSLLIQLTKTIQDFSQDSDIRVIVLQSRGERTFCAGASLEELQELQTMENAEEYFLKFLRLLLSMRNCPKPILCRVQGKAVGGGIGLIAASDYALALHSASVRLSELSMGIGPFVIGPAIVRKIGTAAFGVLALDTQWHSASWCKEKGLFADIFDTVELLDQAIFNFLSDLIQKNPKAVTQVKSMLWHGTEDWEAIMVSRARMSAQLLLESQEISNS